jgi:hypothetical protein
MSNFKNVKLLHELGELSSPKNLLKNKGYNYWNKALGVPKGHFPLVAALGCALRPGSSRV